jgi:V-type H+-transporting ATPase subunit a
MKYYNLVIPRESAWEVMNQLGDLECLHFVDYDPSLPMINRPFANYIKRLQLAINWLGVTIH